jgi:hypothetical protein
MEQISKFILLQRGEKLNIQSDTFDLDKVQDLIQSGKMIVLPNHLSLENSSEETVYETLGSGVMVFVRNGLYQFTVQYNGSTCLSKALSQLSAKSWDLFLVDISQKVFGEYTVDGYFKGFEASLVQGENMTFNDGATASKKPLRLQLSTSGTRAFNERIDYYVSESVDFVNLEGVEDVYLEVISSKASDLKIAVVNGCDKTTAIEGLDNPNYWKVINSSGTAVVPATITYVDGYYKFTGVAVGDYVFSLYDKTNSKNIVAIGTNFLKTTRNTAIAVTV